MKDETKRRVWHLPELTDSLLDVLIQNGFQTGSEVYTSAKVVPADKDWVVNVPPYVFNHYTISPRGETTNTDPDYDHGGMTVLYGHRDGIIYNIMCMGWRDFEVWALTTKIMGYLRQSTIAYGLNSKRRADLTELFDKKWKRVRVFRAFRDVLTEPILLDKPLSQAEAWDRRVCRWCGQEAINFIDNAAREQWQRDGICDRCKEG